ncbi:MAG: hypothetical protein FJ298_07040 [Planctomycetes bacterium]|nr:hypothetical protein [Planctomycetota bacterium]
MDVAPHFLTEEDIYERGWSAEILAASRLEPYQQLELACAPNARPVRVYLASSVEALERMDVLQDAVAERFDLRADRDELAKHLRRFAYLASIPPREELPHADRPFAFLEWWLQRMAEDPNLESRELERRRGRRRAPRS